MPRRQRTVLAVLQYIGCSRRRPASCPLAAIRWPPMLRSSLSQLSFTLLFPLVASHSIKPDIDTNIATSMDRDCYVRLIRRVSKSTACWPDGDKRRGGHFGCTNNNTVYTTGHCAGLFACGNGQTVMCKDTSCKCPVPCHLQPYMQNELWAKGLHCPPALPSFPYPPPLPPVPPMPPPPSPPPAGDPHDGRMARHAGHHHGDS